MPRFAAGTYTPRHPEKYIGEHAAKYRSSWELNMMRFLDENKNIKKWGSEVLQIKYRHPITGKIKNYIPDFFVVYEDRAGQEHREIIEIKPRKQTVIEGRQSMYDKLSVAVNHAKWRAATAYCQAHGFTFRIVTEADLFHQGRP